MTDIDWKNLRELCDKATPGDWWIDSHGRQLVAHNPFRSIFITHGEAMGPATRNPETGYFSHWPNDWDASYIVAVQPKVVRGLLDEIDRLNILLIERETVRIGQSLQRHDDQKQFDDLVALGIQQDKDEIASLKEKVSRLEENCRLLALHGEVAAADADWASDDGREAVKERDRLKAENAKLRSKLAIRESRRPPAEIKRNGLGWMVKLQNGSAFGSFETAESARDWAVSNGFGARP